MRLSLPALLALSSCLIGVAASKADTLVIGVELEPYYPIYQYENNGYTGAAGAILDAFAKSAGHTIVYKAFPIPRLYKSFIEGEVDYKFPDNEKWQQDLRTGVKITYSGPVIAYVDGANVLAARKADDLSKVSTLGIPLGFTPWEYKGLIADKKITVTENPRFEGLIQQALAGRVDALYASVSVVAYQVKKMNHPGELVFAPNLPHTKDAYRLSTIKHPEMLAQFDKWLSDNAAAVAAIKAQYGAEDGF